MTHVGVDGSRAGWVATALSDDGRWSVAVLESVAEILDRWPAADHVLVDMPIGLPAGSAPRACDIEARRALGRPRGSSVFPAPARETLAASSYQEAGRVNRAVTGRGLTRQSWAIAPKIREVDRLLRADAVARERVREVHPEVAFWGLAGASMSHNKKRTAGREERLSVLEPHFPPARQLLDHALGTWRRKVVGADDVLDALVAAIVARLGDFSTLPAVPEHDARGLPMEMVYASAS